MAFLNQHNYIMTLAMVYEIYVGTVFRCMLSQQQDLLCGKLCTYYRLLMMYHILYCAGPLWALHNLRISAVNAGGRNSK